MMGCGPPAGRQDEGCGLPAGWKDDGLWSTGRVARWVVVYRPGGRKMDGGLWSTSLMAR